MDHIANTLAVVCSAGGIAGYIRKGSVPSLAAGVGVGTLYGVAGYLLHKNADWGLETAIGASTLLTLGSFPRALKTRKPLPFMLTAIGLGTLGYYGKKYSDFYL